MLRNTNQVISRYGKPTETGREYLTFIPLPYPMRLSWDTDVIINRMRCHEKVADNFIAVFDDLLEQYTLDGIQQLGIDLYGGCFNYRKMRNGTSWSKHSWGIALDLDPLRNLLRESSRTARFARREYEPMIDIFYHHGFINLGVEKNYDWMHFEIGQ
jgi:hypothetical protein